MGIREFGVSHGRRVTPPLSGSTLRQLRVAAGLSASKVGRWYGAKGVSRARICQIEASTHVNKIVESLYRAAVDTAVLARDKKVGALIRPDLDSLKPAPESER